VKNTTPPLHQLTLGLELLAINRWFAKWFIVDALRNWRGSGPRHFFYFQN
jgi:hypothetical protein